MESKKDIIFDDWGVISYCDAYKKQRNLFDIRVSARQNNEEPPCDIWVFCEHLPVVTIGQHGNRKNLLYSSDCLREKGVDFYATDRGGDVTFHGRGQCVCYPLFDLERREMGLRRYVELLEEVVIRTVAEYGITAGRLKGASGVWIEPDTPYERKICAVGIRSSRYITMHGIALNVNTDLSYFSLINPCGFADKGVTSIEKEIGRQVSINEVKADIEKNVLSLFR